MRLGSHFFHCRHRRLALGHLPDSLTVFRRRKAPPILSVSCAEQLDLSVIAAHTVARSTGCGCARCLGETRMDTAAMDRPSHSLSPQRAARIRQGLDLFLEAYADAGALGRPADETSLDLHDLHEARLYSYDLRWLVLTGHLEVTPPSALPDAGDACNGGLVFMDHSRFFLTPSG